MSERTKITFIRGSDGIIHCPTEGWLIQIAEVDPQIIDRPGTDDQRIEKRFVLVLEDSDSEYILTDPMSRMKVNDRITVEWRAITQRRDAYHVAF